MHNTFPGFRKVCLGLGGGHGKKKMMGAALRVLDPLKNPVKALVNAACEKHRNFCAITFGTLREE
jgi:hypothetical protein